MLDEHHQVVEGARGIAVAALLAGRVQPKAEKIGIVVSGGNIGREKLLGALRLADEAISPCTDHVVCPFCDFVREPAKGHIPIDPHPLKDASAFCRSACPPSGFRHCR